MTSAPHEIKLSQLSSFFACLSLAGTVTNYTFLSCFFIAISIFIPLIFSKRQYKVSQFHLWASALFAYFILHTIIYAPSSFITYKFFRYDGNFFITFLPLALLSGLTIRASVTRIVKGFIIWATLVNAIGIILYFNSLMLNNNEYAMFFYAHNAAGGFLCSLSLLNYGELRRSKSVLFAFTLAINLFGAYITKSRGSILGMVISFVVVILLKNRHHGKVLLLGGASLIFLLCFSYPVWIENGMKETSFFVDVVDPSLFDRVGTVVDRGFFLWPRAIYLWLHSPIFGTGFGSYNDVPYNLVGFNSIAMLNYPLTPIYSDAHAHQSFLHILAETGLVGLALVFKFLQSISNRIRHIVKCPNLRESLQLLFWFNIWSSFTEHRLFTPSQVFPFTLLLGLCLAVHNYTTSKYGGVPQLNAAP